MCRPLFLLILAQALIQVSHGLKCNLCHSTGDFSFNCTGDITTLQRKDDACIATVVGKIEENNFVVIQTAKQAATSFRFPSKAPGCYFYSSFSQKKLTTAVCQCRDEDFCIEKFRLDEELKKMQLSNVTCNHHIDSKNDTCQGSFCTVNLESGNVTQDCGYGWLSVEFDFFENAAAYPICVGTDTNNIRTCHCATDRCNTAYLVNNVNWAASPVGCYTNQNGGAINSGRCIGSYCTSAVQEDCPHCEYTRKSQLCVNSTVNLTTNELAMESVDSNGKIYFDILKSCRSISESGCNELTNPVTTTTAASEHTTTKSAGRNEMAFILFVFCFIALFV